MKILEKYYYHHAGEEFYQGIIIFELKIGKFTFRWFTDCGDWFIYLQRKSKWWQFSSAGYMSWKDIKDAKRKT